MQLALLFVALAILLLLALLLVRVTGLRGSGKEAAHHELSSMLARLDAATAARLEAVDSNTRVALEGLRTELSHLRRDAQADADRTRETAHASALLLREEVLKYLGHLTQTITTHLADLRSHSAENFSAHRTDTAAAGETLRLAVREDLERIQHRLNQYIGDTARQQSQAHDTLHVRLAESRDALHTRLAELGTAQQEHQERLRSVMEQRLEHLNTTNAGKLEEMRVTVDEKLNATLHNRLTESFGQVTTHLGQVQKGLGEMKELATGVGDLKKVLSNVKARGIVGEFQLGLQLEQMFSPEQYVKNARIKPNSAESVEFALKLPSGREESVLLPIDAKFPREDWERLEHAYEQGSADDIAAAGRLFERAIRTEGRRISDKYIDPPTTLRHAIMFLPTEGLYAEVVRRPGLLSELQQQHSVTVAGPATFMAILTSFQMSFHTIAIEKKGSEVWKVLSRAKDEFGRFGGLMEKVERQVGTVQNTLKEINGKTTTINRALRDVALPEAGAGSPVALPALAEEIPLLAAVADPDLT